MSNKNLKYRPDIDGLRALAVLLVTIFHAFPETISGGFVGVDVFFVISGYLITSILLKDFTRGSFSLSDFYRRRVHRLFPALIAVLLFTLGVGWFLLTGKEMENLGNHTLASTLFASNLLQMTESGYFATATEHKPLAHFWSLSIEEQFYFFWPLLLGVLFRHRIAFVASILLCVASFLVNLWLRSDRVLDYFSPQTRAWELLLGCIIAIFLYTELNGKRPPIWERYRLLGMAKVWSGLGVIGLVLIVCFGFWLTSGRQFPGFWAVFPVVGSGLLILAGAIQPNSFVTRLLSLRALVWIGLISYPLYLFHWPILVYLRFLSESGEPSVGWRFAAIALSVLLSWLVFRFLEKPIRHYGHERPKSNRAAFALTSVVVCFVLIGAGAMQNGFATRDIALKTHFLDAASDDWDYDAANVEDGGLVGGYELRGRSSEKTLFIGDSLMGQWYPRVAQLYNSDDLLPKYSTQYLSTNHCWPNPYGLEQTERCSEYYEAALAIARGEGVARVVLGGRWQFSDTDSAGIAKFIEEIESLRKMGKEVFLIDVSPESPSVAPVRLANVFRRSNVALAEASSLEDTLIFTDFWNETGKYQSERVAQIAEGSGAEVVNVYSTLCPDHECPVVKDEKAVFMDALHLSASFVSQNATFIDILVN